MPTYGIRSGSDAEMEGWFRADGLDLFLWFSGDSLAHLQVCAGRDVMDWSPLEETMTGRLLEGGSGIGVQAAHEDTITGDRQISDERLSRLAAAVDRTALPIDVRDFVLAMLRRAPVLVADSWVARAVRVLPAAGARGAAGP